METNQQPAANPQQNFFTSKTLKWTICVLGGLIIIVGSFALGIRVGLQEARFTESWAQNYPNNFGGTGPIVAPPQERDHTINSHGIVGTILSIDKDYKTIVIMGSDNVEKTVDLESGTTIRQNFDTVKPQDLKENDSIIVIGEPEDQGSSQGQIDAKFIRVLSQP
jgi:hypothetical protein